MRGLADGIYLFAAVHSWWGWIGVGMLLAVPWVALRLLPARFSAAEVLQARERWGRLVIGQGGTAATLAAVGLGIVAIALFLIFLSRTEAGRAYWLGSDLSAEGGVTTLQILGILAAVAVFLVLASTHRREHRQERGACGNAHFAALAQEWGPGPATIAELLVHAPNHADAGWRFHAPRLARETDGPWQKRLQRWDPACLALASLSWTRAAEHLLVIGKSGCGKTKSFYNQLLLTLRIPWIFQDVKGGLPCRDRNPDAPIFGLDIRHHATRSGVWNPCQEVDTRQHADLLGALLLPDTGRADDWVRPLARSVLTAILRTRRWESLQAIATFVLEKGIEGVIPSLDRWTQDQLSEEKSRSIVTQELDRGAGKLWLTQRVREITEGQSTVTLDDFIRRGGYVLACETSVLKAPITLFWGLLFQRLEDRRDDCPDHLVLLLDEFARAGAIPEMDDRLAVLRSKGVSIVGAIQGPAYLRRVYGHFAESVMENFGTKVYLLRNMDWSWKEMLTRQLGTWTLVRHHGKGTPPEERPVDLVPQDAWAPMAETRVTMALGNWATWWVPAVIDLPAAPPLPLAATEEDDDLAPYEEPEVNEAQPIQDDF
jgi:hypothetical protein